MNAIRSVAFYSMLGIIRIRAKLDYRVVLNKDLLYKRATEFLRGDHCHHKQTLYLRTASNGALMYFYGCSTCAKRLSAFVSHKFLKDKDKAQPADVYDSLCDNKSDGYNALASFFHENWWWAYNKYLESNEWRSLRLKVLKRDNGKCVLGLNGCTRRAVQVHHLTYRRVTREDMNDLVSVCLNCHERHHSESFFEGRFEEWQTSSPSASAAPTKKKNGGTKSRSVVT